MENKNENEMIQLKQKESPLSYLKKDEVKKRLEEIMGKKAGMFIASVASAINTNSYLKQCDGQSVVSAAVIAATLDLPINQSLGFAYIIPYKGYAQFQMGYKGFIQLAMRSGQYKTINVSEVYEGEIKKISKFTGEIEFGEKISDKVMGYVAYFKLVNGFEKFLYMSVEDIQKHAQKYSQSYRQNLGVWKEDFDAMAKKTVLKMLLAKYGVLSVEMQKAITTDQAVVINEEKIEYFDNSNDNVGQKEQDNPPVKLKRGRKPNMKEQEQQEQSQQQEVKEINDDNDAIEP